MCVYFPTYYRNIYTFTKENPICTMNAFPTLLNIYTFIYDISFSAYSM